MLLLLCRDVRKRSNLSLLIMPFKPSDGSCLNLKSRLSNIKTTQAFLRQSHKKFGRNNKRVTLSSCLGIHPRTCWPAPSHAVASVKRIQRSGLWDCLQSVSNSMSQLLHPRKIVSFGCLFGRQGCLGVLISPGQTDPAVAADMGPRPARSPPERDRSSIRQCPQSIQRVSIPAEGFCCQQIKRRDVGRVARLLVDLPQSLLRSVSVNHQHTLFAQMRDQT